MLKSSLTPYILVSILIHTGLLLGIHTFLKLPDAELEPEVLIPVELVVTREPSPDATLKVAASEPTETMLKDLIARSRPSTDIEAGQTADDITDPPPAEVDYQPLAINLPVDTPQASPAASERQTPPGQADIELSRIPFSHFPPADEQMSVADPVAEEIDGKPLLAVDERPTPSPTTSPTPTEKLIASEPVSLAVLTNALHLFPAEPSSPLETTPLDIKPAGDLVEAEIALMPQLSQTAKEAHGEPVTLASQTASLNLAPVAALPPPGSIPLDISTSADPVEARAAANQRLSQQEKEIASEPVDAEIQMAALHLSPVAALPPSGSIPLDINTSADPVEVKTSVRPRISQATQMAPISPLDIGTGDEIISELRPLPTEAENEPRLMASTLRIDSQPRGAQVYVNDGFIGETPLVWELPLGKYEVRLALPDYYGWYSQFNLTESNLAHPVEIRLVPVE